MQRKALLTLAAMAVVGLVCVALVVLPGSRPITVQLAKALQSHDDATLTFEIKNNTAGFYRLGSFAVLELRNDAVWEEFLLLYCPTTHAAWPRVYDIHVSGAKFAQTFCAAVAARYS